MEWAIKEKVDVISIPWGIDEESPPLTDTVAEANKAGISILAAGRNFKSWRLDPVPARYVTVLEIASADGIGEPTDPLLLPFQKNFYSTLGEAVMGAQPSTLGALHIRRDGTSTATCVATGLVVLLIDYARRSLKIETLKPHEVEWLLFKMSDASSDHTRRYLVPWTVFSPNRDIKSLFEKARKPLPPPSKTPY